MNIRKYLLITDTSYDDPNPGDILIGKGIEYLLLQAEKELCNFPIFRYTNIFNVYKLDDNKWLELVEDIDYIILCGTPQLSHHIPPWFSESFYNKLRLAKKHNKRIANLWIGIVNQNYTNYKNINPIINSHKSFIQKNFSVYDLIVSRSPITKQVLDKYNIQNYLLYDLVCYSPFYYDIKPKNSSVNLVVVRNLGDINDKVANNLQLLAQVKLDKTRPTLYLAHDLTDYRIFKRYFPNIVCVNNPKSLVEIYSHANQVISLRVHGSVLASVYKRPVIHILVDSRSTILEHLGLKVYSFKDFLESPLECNFHIASVDNSKLVKDKNLFISVFYKHMQIKLGKSTLQDTLRYFDSEYWTKKNKSNYSSAIIRTSIQRTLADIISKLHFKQGLELGCGGGYFIYLMNTKGKRFVGVDISKYAIDEGINKLGLKDQIFVSSIHDLSMFPNNSFDIVYSQQVLEHLPTELVPLLIKELKRVCKKGCLLYLFLVLGYEDQIAKADNDIDKTHINLKPKEWWDYQFSKEGFKPINTDYIGSVKITNINEIKNTHRIFYIKS